MNSKRLILNLS